MGKEKVRIEVSEERINELIDEVENSNLSDEARDTIIDSLRALVELDRLVGLKSATIARLRKVFGKQSERQKKKDPKSKKPAKGNTGGNGRHGQNDYPGAKEEFHPLEELSPKGVCPECQKGKLYPWEPGIHVRITGHPPLDAVIHKTEKLRCNLCGKIFEANFNGRDDEKFDAQAKSIIALLHYKSSLPFYRLEMLQKKLGLPTPRSTLWAQVESLAERLHPIWKALVATGANGELFFIDDTKAKVLSLMLENELQQDNKKHRRGLYTTGILSNLNENQVVLYFTGRRYSGENLRELMSKRVSTESIAVMSDALNHNELKEKEALSYLCLVHGRRNFVDLEERFKEESKFVLDLIGQVYENEAHCKKQNLSARERLDYHKRHSGPVMAKLKQWVDTVSVEKRVEPNSTLGKGVKYLQRHWKGLTAFLRHEGAPLDNNILEQQLRMPVLNRKNWLFFKNEYGAFVGDIMMSLIKTCDLNEVNAFEYMTAIYNNFDQVKSSPERWLPWNYAENKI